MFFLSDVRGIYSKLENTRIHYMLHTYVGNFYIFLIRNARKDGEVTHDEEICTSSFVFC